MNNVYIRAAEIKDIPAIDRLLYEVHKVHSDARPDIFKAGAKKYTDAELEKILTDKNTPVFVAVKNNAVAGYAFCIYRQFLNNNNLTGIKTLYIDDLCVEENLRGEHIGKQLYDFVINYAKQNGCYNVTLSVWAVNAAAVKFYEKIGMKIQKIGMETVL